MYFEKVVSIKKSCSGKPFSSPSTKPHEDKALQCLNSQTSCEISALGAHMLISMASKVQITCLRACKGEESSRTRSETPMMSFGTLSAAALL